ncbi:MAG: hypothetical protein KDC92_11215, partial [Bacteroidetes bacterium]|nr:hypothetical protein [Bacteroidota bacterium]
MRALSLGVLAIFSMAIFTMCTHESLAPDGTTKNKDIPCDPDTVYFVNTIKPLIVSGCAIGGCHDEKTAEHRVILTTYTKISDYVKEGDADKSELYEVLFKSGEDRMPPPPHDAFTDAEK